MNDDAKLESFELFADAERHWPALKVGRQRREQLVDLVSFGLKVLIW